MLVLLLALLLPATTVVQARQPPAAPAPFLAYHASWDETPATAAEGTSLARLPAFVDIVALAFARPDLRYAGDLDLSGSGLEYPYPGPVLRDAIRMLKERSPGTRVIVSVGGAGRDWRRFDEHALARLVRDLGADGVDLDFEPDDPGCATRISGRIICASNGPWIDFIERTRAVLPRPFLLTLAAWSVGAYGEGRFADDLPRSPWTGSMLAVLRSPAARLVDMVSVMAYDAGPLYDPDRAFAAYRSVWDGPLLLGMAVMPMDASSPVPAPAATAEHLRVARDDPGGGAMLYALRFCPREARCRDGADYRALAAAICRALQRAGCEAPIP